MKEFRLDFLIIITTCLQGNASGGKRAQNSGLKGDALIGAAWSFIEQKSVLPQHPPSGSSVIS